MHALGISKTSFYRWMKEDGQQRVSKVKRPRRPKLDNFDKYVVKRCVINMFKNKELVTLRKLKKTLLQDHNIDVSKQTLCTPPLDFHRISTN